LIHGGFPGSVHDTRILQNTDWYIHPSLLHLPPGWYIVGDEGYQTNSCIITPFTEVSLRHLPAYQQARRRKFNHRLSQTRICVEQAFGRLKRRWQRLFYLDCSPEDARRWFIAAVTLHNFLEQQNDIWPDQQLSDEDQQRIMSQLRDRKQPQERIDSSAAALRDRLLEMVVPTIAAAAAVSDDENDANHINSYDD
jgi:hypothetical protein